MLNDQLLLQVVKMFKQKRVCRLIWTTEQLHQTCIANLMQLCQHANYTIHTILGRCITAKKTGNSYLRGFLGSSVKQDIRADSVNSNNSSALYSKCPNTALQRLAAQNLYAEPLLRVSQTGFILGECMSQQTLEVHKWL